MKPSYYIEIIISIITFTIFRLALDKYNLSVLVYEKTSLLSAIVYLNEAICETHDYNLYEYVLSHFVI